MSEIEKRKNDHIELTFKSRLDLKNQDRRFIYHALSSGHPLSHEREKDLSLNFLDSHFGAPLWVSSMTGGAKKGRKINENLGRCVRDFKLGMGLGSCRPLLESDDFWNDFHLRPIIGPNSPLFANLGVAQIEDLLMKDDLNRIHRLVDRLEANGLIIHVNPLQEWIQPNGDQLVYPPIDTITEFVKNAPYKVIVKEVGQGMSFEDLDKLMKLPLEAIEFGALGGTNFSLLESLREENSIKRKMGESLSHIGHSAEEMVNYVNTILLNEKNQNIKCRNFIISGGITNSLDGHFLVEKMKAKSVFGMASALLKYASGEYGELEEFVSSQLDLLHLAKKNLSVK